MLHWVRPHHLESAPDAITPTRDVRSSECPQAHLSFMPAPRTTQLHQGTSYRYTAYHPPPSLCFSDCSLPYCPYKTHNLSLFRPFPDCAIGYWLIQCYDLSSYSHRHRFFLLAFAKSQNFMSVPHRRGRRPSSIPFPTLTTYHRSYQACSARPALQYP